MDIQQPTGKTQESIKSHAQINKDPSISIQARIASAIWDMFNKITNVCEKLGIARGKLSIATMQSGFNCANETATAGLLQLGGSAVLAGTGVAQGVAGCKSATEITKATELRGSEITEINERTMQEGEPLFVGDSNITVEVEALDEPVTPRLDEIEEEIFYDAEETLSCKQTKPEEQPAGSKLAEKAMVQNKITKEEAEKLIKKAEREYDVRKNLTQAKAGKLQGLAAPGQGTYCISQGLAEVERSKGQKETVQQQVEQDNQNQLGNITDDLKRKADRMTEFNPSRTNSSSLRG